MFRYPKLELLWGLRCRLPNGIPVNFPEDICRELARLAQFGMEAFTKDVMTNSQTRIRHLLDPSYPH